MFKISTLLRKVSSLFKKTDPSLKKENPSKGFPSFRQIKYLPKFLSIKEKIIILSALIIIIICLLSITYIFWKENFIDKPAFGGTYSEGIVGSPQKINPLYASVNEADRDLTHLIFAGLIKQNQEQEILPDLAKDWYVDESQTKYTFTLRNDIKWPDEKPFSAEDVIFTFNAIQNKDYQSPLQSTWENITLEAVDEYTVQFTLPKPYSAFLENLTVGILPSHLWQDIKGENAPLAQLNIEPIGLGAYKFESYTKDKQELLKSYTLIRNEDYHLDLPYIKQITLKFYPNFELAVEALKSRSIDGLNFLPQNLKSFLENRKDLNYYSLSLPQYTAIFFNQSKNELLKDINIRKALSLSINKDKIIATALDGQGLAIDGPLLPGFPGYNLNQDSFIPDVDKAKQILQNLGWKKKEIIPQKNEENNEATSTDTHISPEVDANGLSKFLYKNDKELTIAITLSDQPQSVAVAELIQKYWQAIGVRTHLKIFDPKQIQNDIITPREFEALLFGEILGSDKDLYAFWHSSQADEHGLNLANYKYSTADQLLEKAKIEEDYDKQAEHYKQFQDILIQQIPAIFLYNPNYTYVVSDKIKGIDLERIITPTDRLIHIESWYIRTKKGLK